MLELKLSIIIPVYNASKYLEACVNSILVHENDEFEIILIDDGSEDQSPEICDKYKNMSNVQVIHQKNAGVSKARNVGLDLARGAYITFVDSDDYVSSDYIITILKAIQTDKDIYFFGSNSLSNNSIENVRQWLYGLDDRITKEKAYDIVLSGKSNEPWDKVYKKDIIYQHGIRFNNNVTLGEDIIFSLNYLKWIKTAEIIKKDIYYYRILSTGLSKKQLELNVLDSRNALFESIMDFMNTVYLSEAITDNAYKFMLQVIVNCCGKLSKNYSNVEIEGKLSTFEWCDKLEKYNYSGLKNKIRKAFWKFKMFKLMGIFFNGE